MELEFTGQQTRHLVQNRWIDLREVTYTMPDGTVSPPFYTYSRKNYAVIVATDEQGRYLCVRQFRPGLGKVTTEFPAGGIDRSGACQYGPDESGQEDPLTAAQRELREETGYEAEAFRHLFDLTINAAYSDNKAHCFLAEGLRKVTGQQLDETENLDYRWMPIGEVMENLHSGGFGNGFNAAAIYRSLEILENKTKS